MARLEGLEPPTYRFEVCRSIQLSYRRALNPGDLAKQFLIAAGLHRTPHAPLESPKPGLHAARYAPPSEGPRWIPGSNGQNGLHLLPKFSIIPAQELRLPPDPGLRTAGDCEQASPHQYTSLSRSLFSGPAPPRSRHASRIGGAHPLYHGSSILCSPPQAHHP